MKQMSSETVNLVAASMVHMNWSTWQIVCKVCTTYVLQNVIATSFFFFKDLCFFLMTIMAISRERSSQGVEFLKQ